MNASLAIFLTLLTLTLSACTKPSEPSPVPSQPADKHYPLKGVVTDLMPDQSSVMVKHEAIPDLMPAMTMLFKTDPTVITKLKKGDTITAILVPQGEDFRIENVKVLPSPQNPQTKPPL